MIHAGVDIDIGSVTTVLIDWPTTLRVELALQVLHGKASVLEGQHNFYNSSSARLVRELELALNS